jgi:poly-gamma-glutamate system protein
MEAAIAALRDEREATGVPLDPRVDRNLTGLIGLAESGLTTTLGSLAAKRTAAAPDMAALVAQLLRSAGVDQGSRVAVNASSSFPGLVLATVCAAEAMGAKVTLIPSIGASSYGANDPRFSWVDIEDALLARRLIATRSTHVFAGAGDDTGRDLDPVALEAVRLRAAAGGRTVVLAAGLAQAVALREEIFDRGAPPVACFVNIGGNAAAAGGRDLSRLPTGLLRKPPREGPGLVHHFASRGVPVINLLHVEGLARRYGVPVDPHPLPPTGHGRIYRREPGQRLAAWGALGGLTLAFALSLRRRSATSACG